MSIYTIGEVASRTGFSASALRYYDGIGLVEPTTRTDSGYRVYDDKALGRLAFIARAKRLGCSLEEITELAGIWDGERCGPVQRRFHELVTDKIHRAQRQAVESASFAAQLQRAAEQLSSAPVDGPCGEDCACVSSTPAVTSTSGVERSTKPNEVPIACTLEAGAMTDRLAVWSTALDHATARTPLADGVRVEFDAELDTAELARLVAVEQQCCAFFSFALTVDQRGVGLEVSAPEDAAAIVTTLFGSPA